MSREKSHERPLRPGDEVEVAVPCVVDENGTIVERDTGIRHFATAAHLNASGYDYVVTLPVDHPSKDPVGTVRGDGRDVWVKVNWYEDAAENFESPYAGYTGVWWNVMCHGDDERVGDDVMEWPVIGVVPGTPAAGVRAAGDDRPWEDA